MFLVSVYLGASGQNLPGGNHKNQFLPGGQKLLRNKRNAPKLELQIEPQLEHRRKRKGFSIHVHGNNETHFILHDVGGLKVQIELPIGPLYTSDIRHPKAYRKIIQLDTSDMLHSRRLHCKVNLHLRSMLQKPTFKEELILSPPLSVVWFDRKRNLFNVNPYFHQQSVADVKRQRSQQ